MRLLINQLFGIGNSDQHYLKLILVTIAIIKNEKVYIALYFRKRWQASLHFFLASAILFSFKRSYSRKNAISQIVYKKIDINIS